MLNLEATLRLQANQLLGAESAQLTADHPECVHVLRLQSALVDKLRTAYLLARRIADAYRAYYFSRVLPRIDSLVAAVESGAEAMMALGEDEF